MAWVCEARRGRPSPGPSDGDQGEEAPPFGGDSWALGRLIKHPPRFIPSIGISGTSATCKVRPWH